MSDIYEKLERFTSVIAADAQAESRKILEEVSSAKESAIGTANDEILADAFQYIRSSIATIRSDAGRRVSKKMMENKRRIYTRREEMSTEVLDELRRRIDDYVQTPQYVEKLKLMLERGLGGFSPDDKVTVLLRAEDMPLAAELGDKGGRLSYEQGRFEMGGMMMSCAASSKQIDDTLDSAWGELQGHFAEMFGLELAD